MIIVVVVLTSSTLADARGRIIGGRDFGQRGWDNPYKGSGCNKKETEAEKVKCRRAWLARRR
jgi:hypothetical protein